MRPFCQDKRYTFGMLPRPRRHRSRPSRHRMRPSFFFGQSSLRASAKCNLSHLHVASPHDRVWSGRKDWQHHVGPLPSYVARAPGLGIYSQTLLMLIVSPRSAVARAIFQLLTPCLRTATKPPDARSRDWAPWSNGAQGWRSYLAY